MPPAALIKVRAAPAPDQSGGDGEAMHYRRPIMQRKKTKRTLQGRKTHEQQVRILERKSDVPNARLTEEFTNRTGRDDTLHQAKRGARQSEWPISRGGLNQESDHNKHNDPGQSGHRPQRSRAAEQKQSSG